MRLITILFPLLSLSYLGVAAPLVDDGSLNTLSQDMIPDELHSLAPQSPNEAHNVIANLEGRAMTCGKLNGQLIRMIKSTTAQYVRTGAISEHQLMLLLLDLDS